MALRMIEIFIPVEKEGDVKEILGEQEPFDVWSDRLSENRSLVRVLLSAERTESVMDVLDRKFSYLEDFRMVLLSVAACIPRPEESVGEEKELREEGERKVLRISREELYAGMAETARMSAVYLVLVVLSAVVAAIGILRGNIAVVVGAMVIAPLLGPNVALSFATTLGDTTLARRALKSSLLGMALALGVSVVIGLMLGVNTSIYEVMSRTEAGLGDVVLALAAGSAAALSLTAGLSSALIGVMVAVALLPPLVTFGMLLGNGRWQLALGAMMLLLVNLICINLAGVLTFLLQGIRPLTWWEADRAKRATLTAIILWSVLLVVLVVLILLSRRGVG